jgi:preprotein translocase subunit SecE
VSKAPTTASQAAPKPDNRLVRYFKETRAELRKVSWPTRKQATNLTLIVLAVTIAMAIFLGAVDLLFVKLLGLIVG